MNYNVRYISLAPKGRLLIESAYLSSLDTINAIYIGTIHSLSYA